MANHPDLANFIWQIADLLRGPYRPPQYERVMLPMTVLRRFDCVLAPTKDKVLREYEKRRGGKLNDDALDKFLSKAAGQRFHNHSPLTFEKLKGDPDNIDKHLASYINGFSANVRRIFEYFEFTNEIEKMRESNILYLVVSKFCDVDLHPDQVDNIEMGLAFENLIRRFNELANETAGDHFTPREVIRLMVSLLFINDDDLLATPGTVRKLLDPACGTGGMLAEAQRYLRDHHPQAKLYAYGQEYNNRAFATAAADMLIKQVDHNGSGDSIRFGDSFTEDQFLTEKFDYLLANPPFGVDWKKQQKVIEDEHEKRGFDGRFGAGLPRVNDGSPLFLQHMVSKFEPVEPANQKHGSRLAIVFNGSPLFTGGAGSGESDIRKWLIENDRLEAIVALPEQMFYNTGIGTYVWIVTNRKEKRRKGKIQLIDARERWKPGGSPESARSLGDKRRHMAETDITAVVREYGSFRVSPSTILFDNADFGYTRVTVERPLRLRYQMDAARKGMFLNSCPELLDDVQEIDAQLGQTPILDWNQVWKRIQDLLADRDVRWKPAEQKLFRSAFTQKDPAAQPVIAKRSPMYGPTGTGPNPGQTRVGEVGPDQNDRLRGLFPDPAGKTKHVIQYEPDPDLRDFENVPLKQDIDEYFRREVLPHVPDSWMDRDKDKVGYEINFNRHFYRYTAPRPLEVIDAELKQSEERFMRLLKEATS